MPEDVRGLTLTCNGGEAARALDDAMAHYLRFDPDTGGALKRAFAADPDMPMAHVMKGYFCLLMASAPMRTKAHDAAHRADALTARATPRERAHAQALGFWADGHPGHAVEIWESILLEHPRDLLAMRLAHHAHFYRGDGQNLRDSVARCLPAWNEGVPDHAYVLGMQAFGLEETHDYARAEAAGRAAVAGATREPWAIHAVAHVMESQGRAEDGIRWLAETGAGWQNANDFRFHVWWHLALMHLRRGAVDEALRLFDEEMYDPEALEYLDMVNDYALLARLELYGVDVGPERWARLAAKVRDRLDDHALAFIDVHYAGTLAAAGEVTTLRSFHDSLVRHAQGDSDNGRVTAQVGLPLVEALTAHHLGEPGLAVAHLLPIRYRLHRLGGSHAQRDLFNMILIWNAEKAGRSELARALVAERRGRNPHDGWLASRAI